jgi:hypothetical protein
MAIQDNVWFHCVKSNWVERDWNNEDDGKKPMISFFSDAHNKAFHFYYDPDSSSLYDFNIEIFGDDEADDDYQCFNTLAEGIEFMKALNLEIPLDVAKKFGYDCAVYQNYVDDRAVDASPDSLRF